MADPVELDRKWRSMHKCRMDLAVRQSEERDPEGRRDGQMAALLVLQVFFDICAVLEDC